MERSCGSALCHVFLNRHLDCKCCKQYRGRRHCERLRLRKARPEIEPWPWRESSGHDVEDRGVQRHLLQDPFFYSTLNFIHGSI